MKNVTVSLLARQAGVKVATVRFYERRGLMPPPPRTSSGYRMYSAEAVRRLQFIRHAKELGFSLAEIADLLRLSSKSLTSTEVCAMTREKMGEIDRKIRELQALRKRLQKLTATCADDGPIRECVVVQRFFA